MQSKQFIRTKEDFVCEHCGASVQGTGYTNHCPTCLWSKHVDVNPGDRKAVCLGMMQPTAIEVKGDTYVLSHTCVTCGHVKRNKVTKYDDMDAVVSLTKKLNSNT
jgi:hypothetical protein